MTRRGVEMDTAEEAGKAKVDDNEAVECRNQ